MLKTLTQLDQEPVAFFEKYANEANRVPVPQQCFIGNYKAILDNFIRTEAGAAFETIFPNINIDNQLTLAPIKQRIMAALCNNERLILAFLNVGFSQFDLMRLITALEQSDIPCVDFFKKYADTAKKVPIASHCGVNVYRDVITQFIKEQENNTLTAPRASAVTPAPCLGAEASAPAEINVFGCISNHQDRVKLETFLGPKWETRVKPFLTRGFNRDDLFTLIDKLNAKNIGRVDFFDDYKDKAHLVPLPAQHPDELCLDVFLRRLVTVQESEVFTAPVAAIVNRQVPEKSVQQQFEDFLGPQWADRIKPYSNAHFSDKDIIKLLEALDEYGIPRIDLLKTMLTIQTTYLCIIIIIMIWNTKMHY